MTQEKREATRREKIGRERRISRSQSRKKRKGNQKFERLDFCHGYSKESCAGCRGNSSLDPGTDTGGLLYCRNQSHFIKKGTSQRHLDPPTSSLRRKETPSSTFHLASLNHITSHVGTGRQFSNDWQKAKLKLCKIENIRVLNKLTSLAQYLPSCPLNQQFLKPSRSRVWGCSVNIQPWNQKRRRHLAAVQESIDFDRCTIE